MQGINCPRCDLPSEWLSTTNEWEYYCSFCVVRFNKHGEFMDIKEGIKSKVPRLENKTRSVLQDWVMELPLRAQGTLLTCVRGCDLTPKHPLDSTERTLVAFLRYCFMVPADPREVDKEPGCFFQSKPPKKWKASELGHYPLHWYSHMMHSVEVIGYCHPDHLIRAECLEIYMKLVDSLHLRHEKISDLYDRLMEDRITQGNVVS